MLSGLRPIPQLLLVESVPTLEIDQLSVYRHTLIHPDIPGKTDLPNAYWSQNYILLINLNNIS